MKNPRKPLIKLNRNPERTFDLLKKLGACGAALTWEANKGFTARGAWYGCDRPDWLIWLVVRARVDLNKITEAVSAAVRLVGDKFIQYQTESVPFFHNGPYWFAKAHSELRLVSDTKRPSFLRRSAATRTISHLCSLWASCEVLHKSNQDAFRVNMCHAIRSKIKLTDLRKVV